MAQDLMYTCCRIASIDELSSHIRTLPTENLSSHLEQCKLVMDLLISRLQDALARCEASIDSEAYDSGNDGVDGDASNGDGRNERSTSLVLSRRSGKKFKCKHGCRRFRRRQELVRHYLCHLKCNRSCQTCRVTYSTANAFIKHKCFKEAAANQQKEELDLFRKEIEEEFGLHPQRRRKTMQSTGIHQVNDAVATVPLHLISVKATQGGLSDNLLLYTTKLSGLHESNQIRAEESIYDNSLLFDPPQHMLLPYVDSILSQSQTNQDWDLSDFSNQDGFLAT